MSVYQTDLSLPKLPIPKLSDTDKNLRDMIRPLVSAQQFMQTEQQLNLFFAANGPASDLQAYLYNWRDSLPGSESWLRPIWDDIYLGFRERLPVNMNYGFELDARRWGAEEALPRFIAALAGSIRRIRDESYEPDSGKAGPLSMDMMKYMIYTRIPCQVRDLWYHLPLTDTPTIAVVCNQNWFLLSLCNESGQPASPESIHTALNEIRQQAGEKPGEPVSAFTAAPREEACALRTELSRHPLNRTNLEGIEKSLFVVCLDPADELLARTGADVICGDAANRWFDKSLQIISSGDRIALNFEHSGCDAAIWVFILAAADSMIMNNDFSTTATEVPHIRKLIWSLSPIAKEGLEKKREDLRQLSQQLIFDRGVLTALGKEAIKALGCSPDAFVQLLYQAAYLELTGKIGSVYEAVAVRGFYQGRTECQRPVSTESVEFARLLLRNENGETLTTAFRAAADKHMERLGLPRKALGSERHMSGLAAMHQMYYGGDLPEIFTDEGYCALRHDVLSTSSVTAPFIDYFGFGPVVNDGMGIGYGIRSDGLHLMVSAYSQSGITPASFLDRIDLLGKRLLKLID